MKSGIEEAARQRKRLSVSAGLASVLVALVLLALKTWAYWMTGALSVAASAADSLLDLLMSLAGLAAIVYAARPPDEDHAFGHSSAEDLASLGQSVVVLGAAVLIGWGALGRLAAEDPPALMAEGLGIAVMSVSVVLSIGLILWQRRVVRRTGNRVVAADSMHYAADLLPNLGALAALAVSARFGYAGLDSIVALAAAVLLIVGAARIGKGAWDALMDRQADPELIAEIEALVADWPGVLGYHDLKSRMAGGQVHIHLHLELEGGQTLEAAHDIGAALKREIIRRHPNVDIIIHKDPVRGA